MDHHFETEHTQTTYEVNGKKYTSLEDVPEPFRSMFADRDADGIPDGLQDVDAEVTTSRTVVRTSRSSREISSSLDPRHPHGGAGATNDSITLRCGICNYDLSESAVRGTCPECGTAVMRSIRDIAHPKRSGFWRVLDGIIDSPTASASVTWGIILAVIISIMVLFWIA